MRYQLPMPVFWPRKEVMPSEVRSERSVEVEDEELAEAEGEMKLVEVPEAS